MINHNLADVHQPAYAQAVHSLTPASSLIQTILSVSEFFLFKKVTDSTASLRVADYTAGWDLHPTPKIVFHLLYSL